MRRLFALVIALIVSAAPAGAQPLADRVPGDALIYVGWVGSQRLEGYEQSHLQGFLAASDAQKLFTETLPQMAQRAANSQPGAVEYTTLLSAIGSRVWRHPSALYVGPVDYSNPRQPAPRLALICDAGDEAAALIKDFQTAVDRAGKTPVAMKVVPQGSVITLQIGPPPPVDAPAPGYLGVTDNFRAALGQLHEKPVATVFMNVEAILRTLEAAPAPGERAQQDRANWVRLRDALGISGAKFAAWSGAFDGRDWSTRSFLAAPAPRTGLLSMLDTKPLSEEILRLIPPTSTMFAATSFDPARLLSDVLGTAGKVDPNAPKQIEVGLDRFRTMTGLDLQKDVLEPLGDQWAVYSDPSVAGTLSVTLALVNKLDDPARAEKSLAQLSRSVSNFLSGMAARQGMTLAFREVQDRDLKIHFMAAPIIRPSWAIQDGVLYLGLYPQVVSAAAQRSAAAAKGESILDNPSFVEVRKRLGEREVSSLRFADLPRSAPAVYPTWLLLTGYAGFSDLYGVAAPAMLLPPLSDLLAHLAPAGAMSWTDESGWHMSGISPFPGSEVLGNDPTLKVAGPSLLASVALPAVARARETANRVRCAHSLREIGLAIQRYANGNKGEYPPDLATLVMSGGVPIETLVCTSSGDDIPREVQAGGLEAQAGWADGNSSYVYVGNGLTLKAAPDTVVLYEKESNHDADGMNFLYADGHVEWQTMQVARQLIKAAGQRQ